MKKELEVVDIAIGFPKASNLQLGNKYSFEFVEEKILEVEPETGFFGMGPRRPRFIPGIYHEKEGQKRLVKEITPEQFEKAVTTPYMLEQIYTQLVDMVRMEEEQRYKELSTIGVVGR